MADRAPRRQRIPLSEQPNELIRVVRACREMGAAYVKVADVEVRFDPFVPETRDKAQEDTEAATKKAAKERESDLLWSA